MTQDIRQLNRLTQHYPYEPGKAVRQSLAHSASLSISLYAIWRGSAQKTIEVYKMKRRM